MPDEEKKRLQAISKAMEAPPEAKQEFILGYAEGVNAMAASLQAAEGAGVSAAQEST